MVQLWGIGGINEATHHRIEARLDALAREKLGLSVKLTMVTRSSYNERLNIAFLQGEAPDLFPIYQQSAFDRLYDSGCLRNLHGYIDEDYLDPVQRDYAVHHLPDAAGDGRCAEYPPGRPPVELERAARVTAADERALPRPSAPGTPLRRNVELLRPG